MIANVENVNTELEQIGMSVFDGVIHLFCGFFFLVKKKVPPFRLCIEFVIAVVGATPLG